MADMRYIEDFDPALVPGNKPAVPTKPEVFTYGEAQTNVVDEIDTTTPSPEQRVSRSDAMELAKYGGGAALGYMAAGAMSSSFAVKIAGAVVGLIAVKNWL